MPTGAADEAIFGSPDLSDFCPPENSGESLVLQPTDAKTQIFPSQWPAANSDALSAFAVQSGGGAAAHSGASSVGFSEQAGSGDEEDILDLISSSLDRFNAQLHRNHQASIPIPVNHSVLPLWTSSTASNNLQQHLHHSQMNQVQGSSINLAYSALSNASPSTSTGVFCGSSNSSSALLHQPPMPSPPGLSRFSQQTPIPGCLKIQSSRKQRKPTQTLSYPEEKSYIWESNWKALPSEMGMLSVDSGIGENIFSPASFSFTSTNSVGELVHPSTPAGFTRDEAPPSQTTAVAAASTSFDFTTAPSAPQSSSSIELTVGGTAPLLRSLIWPPSWPNTNECTSTATPKPHFRPGDNQQHQFALFSRFESAIRQQQQPPRPSYNRRKAESNCFVSATHLNQALTLPTTLSGHAKSHSLAAAATGVGQLGSPPGELCQSESKSYATTPQKFARDLQQQPTMNVFTKPGTGFPGGSKAIAPRPSGPCRSKRIDTTPSFSSSSSTSSSDASDKPVVAKWRRACSFYLRGHCKKEDCEFAHDLTKVTCKFWEVGECFKGMTCPFLHGYPPEFLLELQQRQNQQAEQLTSNG